MKKVFYATLALGALILASCQKENSVNGTKVESPVFTAYIDTDAPAGQPETKTVLDGNKSEWKSGDAIRVLNGTNIKGCDAVYTTTDNGASATFTTTADKFTGTEFIAMYPASPAGSAWWNAAADKTVNKLWLTDTQDAVEGGYDPTAHIAVAYTDTKSFVFKNVVALLKISVLGTGVKNISVSADNIAGNFSYNTATGDVIKTGDGYSNKSMVTLSGTFTDGKDYYIAVLPGTYSEFALSVNGITVNKKSSDVTFKSGKIYNLGSVRAPFNWGVVGGFNSWAVSSPVLLYDTDGDGIYELKGQSLVEGFKFVRFPECGWTYAFGVHKPENGSFVFDTEMNGGWYTVYTNNISDKKENIIVSDTSKKWDIYIYEFASETWGQGINYTVLPAGDPTPSK